MRIGRSIGAAAMVFAAGTLAGPALGTAQDAWETYEGHSIVVVEAETREDIARLISLGLDIWTHSPTIGPIEIRVAPGQENILVDAGFEPRVLLDNLAPMVRAERERLQNVPAMRGPGNYFDDYRRYDEMSDYTDVLVATRPDLAERITLGQTLQGRDQFAMRITSNVGENKPIILLHSLQHAREWITGPATMYMADRFIHEYGVDEETTLLLDAFEWIIVPVVNADGYEHAWDSQRLWRKTRRNNGDGTFGVDPNRNWGFDWGGEGSSGNSDSDIYRGPFPFSEPCTDNLRTFFETNDRSIMHVDIHSFSQLLLSPWGARQELAPDHELFVFLGANMAREIFEIDGRNYTPQRGIDLYPAAGTAPDWTYGDQNLLSWTFELRPQSQGQGGFIIPPDQIIPTAMETDAAIRWTAAWLADNPLYFDVDQIDFAPSGQSVRVDSLVYRGLKNLNGTSVTLFTRSSGDGAFTPAPMIASQRGFYQAQADVADNCGGEFEYYIQAQTTDGQTVTFPPDGADAPLTAPIVELEIAFEDSFEAPNGWSVTNQGGLSDGAWQRGVPAGGGERGDPPADFDGSGSCYLTANRAGNSDVDGGATTLTSRSFDLSGAEDRNVVLSYARWYHNAFGNAPFTDVFTVEISNDGGQNWTNLETVGPDGPEVVGGWIPVSFVISDLIEMTDDVRVRFIAEDAEPGSVVEAAIDAISVDIVGCDEDECRADWNGDGSVNAGDVGAFLSDYFSDLANGTLFADFDGNGVVNASDVGAYLGAYFQGCP